MATKDGTRQPLPSRWPVSWTIYPSGRSEGYQPSAVRVITIDPGQETSEHYHQLRDEMWVVLDEGLRIQIGNRVVDAKPGEEFVVQAEEPHRITNRGTKRGRVLEVAHGYTTEDDTLRIQDDYGRPLEPRW